jgi:negative regulator of sigma E activity
MTLDARLRSLYQGLDTSPGFDARLMARVSAELDASAAEKAARARAQEQRRYELAKRTQSWGAWLRRAVTLETLGAVAFAGCVVHNVWVGLQPQVSPLTLPVGVTALGIMLALAAPPLLLRCHRRMSRHL